MAVLKTRLEWYGNQGENNVVVMEDWTRINVRLALELKSNLMTIDLKNNFGRSGGRQFVRNNKLISTDDTAFFRVDDKFKLYCKYDTNNSGLDLNDNSNDLIFSGDLKEAKAKGDMNISQITLVCTDRTFSLLNGLHWYNYRISDSNFFKDRTLKSEGWTSPLIIQHTVRKISDTNKSSATKQKFVFDEQGNNPPTGSYSAWHVIDARLYSEGGFIQDDRSKTIDKNRNLISRTIGTPDSKTELFPSVPINTRNYNFPLVNYPSIGKPAYQVLKEVSQINMTNTADELDRDPPPTGFDVIIKRAMKFYIDEKNRVHWFYPIDWDDTNKPTDKFGNTLEITMGTTDTYETKDHQLNFSIFDVVNFIYFEAGQDMNGNVIIGFKFDSTSGAPVFKQAKRSWPKIAESMKQREADAGNILVNAGVKGGYNYPTSYNPLPNGDTFPAWWDGSTDSSNRPTDNASYNKIFKEQARKIATAKANSIIAGSSSQRWKGNINFSFYNFTIGDLIQYTSSISGIYQEKLRITELSHDIKKNGAFTTLNVENDEKELEA